jgi:hypothetical protein
MINDLIQTIDCPYGGRAKVIIDIKDGEKYGSCFLAQEAMRNYLGPKILKVEPTAQEFEMILKKSGCPNPGYRFNRSLNPFNLDITYSCKFSSGKFKKIFD